MTFNPNQSSSLGGAQATTGLQAAFLTQAFVWMFLGLLLTAGVAVLAQTSEALLAFAANNLLILFIGQLAIVFVIASAINRIGATAALGLFFVYAATLGITVGVIVAQYTGGTVASAFFTAAAMFGGAALYGYTTKRSLAGMGGFLVMGVIGLIVAIVVNLFILNSVLSLVISVIGVVIFTALTAYDVQRISSGQLAAQYGSVEKAAVIGALRLYLDFINIFLFLLRLMGGNRN